MVTLLSLLVVSSTAFASPQESDGDGGGGKGGAHDGPLLLGGGIDAGAGAVFPAGQSPDATLGVPQVEGDLGVHAGVFAMRVDLDLGVLVADGALAPLTLVPEQAWMRLGSPKLYLAAGDFVAPWREESVDPWDRGLTSTSMLALHALPWNVAGVTFGGGSKLVGVEAVAGADLGAGINLLADPSTWAPQAPVLLGARAYGGEKVVRIGLGGYYRPVPRTGGVTLDARVDGGVIVVEGEGLLGVNAADGAMIATEIVPHFVVSPTARLEWYDGQPGGALGVAIRPLPFLRFAAEGAYTDGAPAVWVSADVYTPGTSRRSGDGGSPHR